MPDSTQLAPAPSATVPTTAPPPGYRFRLLEPADARGVVHCVREIYGDSYVHPELYDADAIVQLNQEGKLVSVVTLDGQGQVVGHYALERPDLGSLAETGEALVLPEHRHHQLMESMRRLLEEQASRLKLVGLFGNVVTNHVFSQRVVERFGELPCAVSLGWSPRTFHNMAQALSQRMSEFIFFKFLRQPQPTRAYLPERHTTWCRRIYSQFEVPIHAESEESVKPTEELEGVLAIEHRPELQRAVLRVSTIGRNSIEEIRAQQAKLMAAGVQAFFLELPLAQPGTPALCEAAENAGFFFSGLAPCFVADGDVLRLQYLTEPLDVSQIQVEHPLAKELLHYVACERARVAAQAA